LEFLKSETSEVQFLMRENERLQLELRKAVEGIPPEVRFEEVVASVYSFYPWNGRRTVMVNKGEIEGVGIGMPVLSENGYLLGKVSRVWRARAEVVTIFDGDWKSPVQIGFGGTKGVLEGGAVPRIGLVPIGAQLEDGEVVLSVGADFPLYANVGVVESVFSRDGNSWQEAEIKTGIDFEGLRRVKILTNFL